MKKVYIYFDTNILECRHSGESLYLSEFRINNFYYKIEDLIHKMKLENKVEICIPEIVLLELQEHLVKSYKKDKDSIKSTIEISKKSFGKLLEISFQLKEVEYKEHVKKITQDFFNNPEVNAKIIPYPRDKKTLEKIVLQSIRSTEPFKTIKTNKKKYTDVGFKDALIFNTIVQHTKDQIGIFISNDNDFYNIFKNLDNLHLFYNIKDIEIFLSTEFKVTTDNMIDYILLKDDKYLLKQILSECNFDEDLDVTNLQFISHRNIEDNIEVKFNAIVDDIKYWFEFTYNINANELLDCSYNIIDESEI